MYPQKTLEDTQALLESHSENLNELHELDIMEMYRHLTDLGKSLVELPRALKTPDNFVHGCTSNVYIHAELIDGRIQYQGASEALVVRGYLAILVESLSGLTPQDLLSGSAPLVDSFAKNTDIKATLTPSRANAFGNIYNLMRAKAQGFV